MKLDFANAIENIIDIKLINKVKKYKEIIIFGAGNSGSWVFNILKSYGLNVSCFCDNYEKKWGLKKEGRFIYSFDKALEMFPNATICVASMWAEEIYTQITDRDNKLLNRTFDLLQTMAWETAKQSNVSTEREYITKHIDDFNKINEMLIDNESKKTLKGILDYRLTRNRNTLRLIKKSETTYFDREILTEKMRDYIIAGSVVDGGAFDGDTIELLLKEFCGTLDGKIRIHAWEIDKKNCNLIEEKMRNYDNCDAVVHNAALWNKSGENLFFQGENGLSARAETIGENAVTTETIDDFCERDTVRFIKLDIEGSEREALEGAKKIIERDSPILAICAYHLQDDLIELTKLIKFFKCDYELLLRHYMCSAGDTILYAIPKHLLMIN